MRLRAAVFVLATVAAAGVAPPAAAQAPVGSAQAAKPAGQGIAVLAVGSARETREEAFALGRAIYGSRLRPTSLDEVRARILAGDPLPSNASRELRELSEVRAAVSGDDAATRRLLTGIAQQIGAQALLVVTVERSGSAAPAAAPATPAGPPAADAGAATSDGGAAAESAATADAGTGNAPAPPTVVARLFLADPGEFDAARYSPEPGASGVAAWKSTATSLEGRFPQPSRTVGPDAATRPAVTNLKPEQEKAKPFYASGWFWGAIAGAALIGGIFYFASRDTTEDPIQLQMRVPR
jgi:hypothetical protein